MTFRSHYAPSQIPEHADVLVVLTPCEGDCGRYSVNHYKHTENGIVSEPRDYKTAWEILKMYEPHSSRYPHSQRIQFRINNKSEKCVRCEWNH
jgi:hypothetical protein